VISKQLVDKLALQLLEGEVREGQGVAVDAKGGELVFESTGETPVSAENGQKTPA
jgi:hypothetical protein